MSARQGYVLLGAVAIGAVKKSGKWFVAEEDVVRAARALHAVQVDAEDLVRVDPVSAWVGGPQDAGDGQALRWRDRIGWLYAHAVQARDWGADWSLTTAWIPHLAGIDWQRWVVERRQPGETSWWIPRAVAEVLDSAEAAEADWLVAARTCETCGAVTEPSSPWRAQVSDGWRTRCPECWAKTLSPYREELYNTKYSREARSRGRGDISGWLCAVCQKKPAFALDHCHDHGMVRAPVCSPCNMNERLQSQRESAGESSRLWYQVMHGEVSVWLRHWHRCAGCRERNTLPMSHMAAYTAHIVGSPLRPRHRKGEWQCGWLMPSWVGSPLAPAACTISVDFRSTCIDHQSGLLAEVPYREALALVRSFIQEKAPDVAAAAGPGDLGRAPAVFRPVVADDGQDQPLF